MEDLIKKIYYGNLYPCEKCGINNRSIKKLAQEIAKKREAIINQLNDKQREELEEYDNLLACLSSEYHEAHFVEGFKIGARLIIELFSNGK